MDNEKVINALKMIKEICKAHTCNDCPFLDVNRDLCAIKRTDPCNWVIKEEKQIWRAFK